MGLFIEYSFSIPIIAPNPAPTSVKLESIQDARTPPRIVVQPTVSKSTSDLLISSYNVNPPLIIAPVVAVINFGS